MTDVAVRATLIGFEDAGAKLNALTRQLNEVAFTDQQWAQVLQNLNKIKEENLAKIKAREEATVKLKAHTADLVRTFQDQERQEALLNSASARMLEGVNALVLRYTSWAAIIAATVTSLVGMRNAALEASEADTRLEATMRATGGTVGFTKEQLDSYAKAMERSTRFTDEQFQNAMAVMLTFKNVSGDTFNAAMEHAANYAELTGTDLVAAVRLVGRAFNDPIHGLQLLERQFGRLDPVQKEHIDQLIQQWRLSEAQAIINQKLDDSFGGLAKKMRDTAFDGAKELGREWRNLLEELGKSDPIVSGTKTILGGLAGAVATVTEMVSNWQLVRKQIEKDALQSRIDDPFASQSNKTAFRERLAELNRIELEEITKLNDDRRAAAQKGEAAAAEAAKRAQEARLKEKAKEHEALRKMQEQENVEAMKIERDQLERQVRDGEAKLEHLQGIQEQQLRSERLTAKEREQIEQELSRTKQQIRERDEKQRKEWQKAAEHDLKVSDNLQKEANVAAIGYAESEIAALKKQNLAADEYQSKLVELSHTLRSYGDAGAAAADKVDASLGKTATQAEQAAKRISDAFGRSTLDSTEMFISFHRSVSGVFADILRGSEDVGGGIKNIFKAAVDAVINEFARLLASDFFKVVFRKGPGGILTGAGGLLGGSTAANAAGESGGSGGLGVLGNLSSLLPTGGLINLAGNTLAGAGFLGSSPMFGAIGGAELAGLAALEGAGAAAGGAAAGAGAGLMAGVGAALPYVGLALAAYSLLKKDKTSAVGLGYEFAGNYSVGGGLNLGMVGLTNVGQDVMDSSVWKGWIEAEMPAAIAALREAAVSMGKDASLIDAATVNFRFRTGLATTPEANAPIVATGVSTILEQLAKTAGIIPAATGLESVVTRPTLFMAGEWPERVRVEPLAGGAGRERGGNVTVQIMGLSLLDNYSARRLAYEIARIRR